MNDAANRRDGWLILATIVAALVIDSMALPPALAHFRPNVLAVLVIYWSLMTPQRTGVTVAWIAGLLVDAMGGGLLGLNAMVLSLQAYVSLMLYQQIRVLPRFQQMLFVFVLLALGKLLAMLILGLAGRLPAVGFWFSLPASALLWPLMYGLLRTWRKGALLSS